MSKTKAGDLYIASVIHVARDGKNEKGEKIKVTETIMPGQMVSDTDLTADEIKDLKRHKGVLRPPTAEEMEAMETADERKSQAEAVKTAEQERTDLAAQQDLERQELEASQKAEDEKQKAKLAAEQAKERDAVAAKAQKAGAKK